MSWFYIPVPANSDYFSDAKAWKRTWSFLSLLGCQQVVKMDRAANVCASTRVAADVLSQRLGPKVTAEKLIPLLTQILGQYIFTCVSRNYTAKCTLLISIHKIWLHGDYSASSLCRQSGRQFASSWISVSHANCFLPAETCELSYARCVLTNVWRCVCWNYVVMQAVLQVVFTLSIHLLHNTLTWMGALAKRHFVLSGRGRQVQRIHC